MIIRKHISILLTLFLLVSNLGLAFNVHYCEDEIASVSLNIAADCSHEVEKDCCGEVEKESKCCKNKIIKADAKSDQIIVKGLSFDAAVMPSVYDWKPIVLPTDFHFKKRDTITYYCDANAPPLYLLYSQYTFYC